jgi:hypothetical protein
MRAVFAQLAVKPASLDKIQREMAGSLTNSHLGWVLANRVLGVIVFILRVDICLRLRKTVWRDEHDN